MLHPKLVAIRVGGTMLTRTASALNRLQFVIENSVNESKVAATTYSPRRNQHILCGKTTVIQSSKINIENAQYHSILGRKSTSSVSISKRLN